ncbi:polysaccharide pyruvyl transferase family protein [Hyphococcus sp.]|uniref:polysaccharide pyruvyl transferase family protein n=1 Tax=Hyphococcus sp. TaxID=2038636 RepID=UPI0035C66E96
MNDAATRLDQADMLTRSDAAAGDKSRDADSVTRIVLTGTYCARNKGDAAMELSAAAALAERFGDDVEVVILAPFAKQDRDFYAPLAVVPCNRRKLILGTLNLIGLWLAQRLGLSVFCRRDPMAQARLVVDLSGDMLTEDYGPHVAYSHFIPFLRALALKKPYVICAQSIGPFKLTLPLARFVLNRAAAITVRDEISFDYLQEISVNSDLVTRTADLAFLLPPADAARAAALDPRAQDDRPVIGVSVSRIVADRYDRRAGTKGAFVDMAADAFGALASETGARLLFVPHVTGPSPSKDDRNISRDVAAKLPEGIVADVIGDDLRPEELKALIARTDLFVGARMHANIAALSSGVPVVAIAYSHKTPGIMRACGVEAYVADIDALAPSSFEEMLARAWKERGQIGETLRASIPSQRLAALQNISVIESVMKGGTE